jgi:hypothetical protein
VFRLTRSLVRKSKKHTSKSPQVRRNIPAFPARRLTTYSVLFLVIGLFCHHRWSQCEKHRRQLDASVEASEPHDFAVRSLHAFVWHMTSVRRIPRPTFVTIAKRPSDRVRDDDSSIAVST